MDTTPSGKPLAVLFSDLSQQTADLIRLEARLAKAELSVTAAAVMRQAIKVGAAAVFGVSAVLAGTAAITLALVALGVTPWLAAVLTSGALAVAAVTLGRSGLSALKDQPLAPAQMVQSVKETTQWIKNETR